MSTNQDIESLGLFDRGPEAVAQAIEAQKMSGYKQMGMMPAGGAQRMLAAQSGGMLGDLISPKVNPQIEQAKKAQEVKAMLDSSGLDVNTSAYYKAAASLLQKAGLVAPAAHAAKIAMDMEKTQAQQKPDAGTLPLMAKYIEYWKQMPEGSQYKAELGRLISRMGQSGKMNQVLDLMEKGFPEDEAVQSIFGKVIPIAPGGGVGMVSPQKGGEVSATPSQPTQPMPSSSVASAVPLPNFSSREMGAIMKDMQASGNPPSQIGNPSVPGGEAPVFGTGQPINGPVQSAPRPSPTQKSTLQILKPPMAIDEREALEKTGLEIGKEYAERVNEIPKIKTDLAQLQALKKAAQTTPTGWGQTTLLEVKKALLPMLPSDSPFRKEVMQAVSGQETFDALSKGMAILAKNVDGKNQLPGNFSNQDLQFVIKMVPSLQTSPQGVQKLLGWLIRMKEANLEYNQQLASRPEGTSIVEWKRQLDAGYKEKRFFPDTIANSNEEIEKLAVGDWFADAKSGTIFRKVGPKQLQKVE